MNVTTRREDRDRGTGILSMAMGMLFFFGFLVFAINITYNLYATSVVSSLALDAARDAAEDGGDVGEAEADFLSEVSSGDVTFSLVDGGDVIRARVTFESTALLPAFSTGSAFGTIDRTFEVRKEEQQAP